MDQDKIYEIIGKELKHEASSDEARILTEWRNQNPYNENLYNQILKVWEKYQNEDLTVEINSKEAWETLERRVESESTPTTIPWISKPIWRVAASILVAISAALYLYQLTTAPDQQKIATTSEKSEILILADGTKVWLNKNSAFDYPLAFDSNTRTVKLNGEAYFEVTPNDQQPFIIESDYGTEVTVVGTAFNYITRPDSAILSVTEGVVQYSTDTQKLRIAAHEEGLFKNGGLRKRAFKNLNTLAWKTGVLQFSDASLISIVQMLEQQFEMDVQLEVQSTDKCVMSATFNNQQLPDILEEISLVFGLSWSQNGNGGFLIQGTSCQ